MMTTPSFGIQVPKISNLFVNHTFDLPCTTHSTKAKPCPFSRFHPGAQELLCAVDLLKTKKFGNFIQNPFPPSRSTLRTLVTNSLKGYKGGPKGCLRWMLQETTLNSVCFNGRMLGFQPQARYTRYTTQCFIIWKARGPNAVPSLSVLI